MKTGILLLCLFIIPVNLLAQRGGTAELYMWTSGFNPTTGVNFFLDACGPVWDEDKDLTTVDTVLNSIVTIPEQYNGWSMSHGDDWDNGWDFVTSKTAQGRPNYGWGLYKVSTNDSEAYFYIDYRDHRWPAYDTPVTGHATDLWLRYNHGDDEFEYCGTSSGTYTTVSDGEYLTIWGL